VSANDTIDHNRRDFLYITTGMTGADEAAAEA
jgi:hypothetical protein